MSKTDDLLRLKAQLDRITPETVLAADLSNKANRPDLVAAFQQMTSYIAGQSTLLHAVLSTPQKKRR